MLKPVIASLVLVLFWWLGTVLSPLLPIPFPAPLIGLLLLFLALVVMGRVPQPLLVSSQFLLRHLSVLFVPAILSVVLMRDMLQTHLMAISIALVFSTAFSLWLTAKISQKLGGKG